MRKPGWLAGPLFSLLLLYGIEGNQTANFGGFIFWAQVFDIALVIGFMECIFRALGLDMRFC
jgi:hypothetical protein